MQAAQQAGQCEVLAQDIEALYDLSPQACMLAFAPSRAHSSQDWNQMAPPASIPLGAPPASRPPASRLHSHPAAAQDTPHTHTQEDPSWTPGAPSGGRRGHGANRGRGGRSRSRRASTAAASSAASEELEMPLEELTAAATPGAGQQQGRPRRQQHGQQQQGQPEPMLTLCKGPLAAPEVMAAAGRHSPLMHALEARMGSKPELYRAYVQLSTGNTYTGLPPVGYTLQRALTARNIVGSTEEQLAGRLARDCNMTMLRDMQAQLPWRSSLAGTKAHRAAEIAAWLWAHREEYTQVAQAQQATQQQAHQQEQTAAMLVVLDAAAWAAGGGA
ncbi:hypothetical protein DUNSADRAFT_1084 [Dunaliella salina]|uniref:Uncharacterized protein n=1 Tax=Dunaliella salina TaxID=3046 RepID=A0ABQ7GXL9_DUNSA|nr:hypothetical protein DUNSADRAFT_1084 [Dunaliella salina]|eukprot:KAF5839307.1 hypothetical protein DUNSADRAFT_1084 [Dunaliella salina]